MLLDGVRGPWYRIEIIGIERAPIAARTTFPSKGSNHNRWTGREHTQQLCTAIHRVTVTRTTTWYFGPSTARSHTRKFNIHSRTTLLVGPSVYPATGLGVALPGQCSSFQIGLLRETKVGRLYSRYATFSLISLQEMAGGIQFRLFS
jgi:hypothetical protein